jgi:hypothetical protein
MTMEEREAVAADWRAETAKRDAAYEQDQALKRLPHVLKALDEWLAYLHCGPQHLIPQPAAVTKLRAALTEFHT